MAGPPEAEVVAVARSIASLGQTERSKVFGMSWWSERMLDWAMSRPAFKTQLFRFVDVFPALGDADDVAAHLQEYFEGVEVPKALDLGVEVAPHVPFGSRVEARVARRNITRMARQFIIGQTVEEAVAGVRELWRAGMGATVDVLGEKTVVGAEADRYRDRVAELIGALADDAVHWAPDDNLERDDIGPAPRVNLSIKATALAAHLEPLTRNIGLPEAKDRLRPLFRLAHQRGAFVFMDMEHDEVKDLTMRAFRELLGEEEFTELDAGVVVQAYRRDSRDDLADLIAFSSTRSKPITVRLVKGAYWDTETIHAAAEGWPNPLWAHKADTDWNYERCVRLLHDHHGEVRAAFGTHNLRSLAYAIADARRRGIPDHGYEVQMLYGMAEPVHAAIRRMGLRLRVYAPTGELVPGMAYLVRRLLENTSQESFVRNRFAEGRDLDELLRAPAPVEATGPAAPLGASYSPRPAGAVTPAGAPGPYEPEPVAEWRRPGARAAMQVAVDRAAAAPVLDVPALVAGHQRSTATTIDSVDPGNHGRVVARSASCSVADADEALAAAASCVDSWRTTPVEERAGLLFRTAAVLRQRKRQIAALEVFEAGKPWDQADADVCEAIDFCEYYGREILRLAAESRTRVQSPPGERNELRYQGKGVAVVIAPWNFPLAIPAGMTVAALVAGNPTILKPAEQTPAVAWALVEALLEAGAPDGVIQFLPGPGETVGARLVEHPATAVIAFTGSRPVGLAINQTAAVTVDGQHHIKRVVAELGGKNALIVDSDADLDQVVPAIVTSAFGYAGQKCSAASRLIVLDEVYDALVPRLVAATAEMPVGHPSSMANRVGPVIDADAYARLTGAIAAAPREGRVLVSRTDLPEGGWYVGPTIVAIDDPGASRLARDELFGPVLVVLRARDLDHALALANDTSYALTAGIFSRSPRHIAQATASLRAGNIYVNRHLTGAIVGRQPFGGYGLSGVGSKAGGPDYLLQYVDPRVVTENTVRQGFAAD